MAGLYKFIHEISRRQLSLPPMKASLFFAVAMILSLASCTSWSGSNEYIYADVYYRYQASEGGYTAEIKLTRRDSTTGLDTAYLAEGGVAFLGSNLPSDLRDSKYIRYRNLVKGDDSALPAFTFNLPDGTKATIASTLSAFDTLIMGPSPTHNFGFTVYPGDLSNTLQENETLSALFEPKVSGAKLATIIGPTPVGSGYVFPRNTVADWPLEMGYITFIRRRSTPISMKGVKGVLVEEYYSAPIADGMVN